MKNKQPSDKDVQDWLKHCEESGNFRGAAEALEELNKRGVEPLQHDY